MLWFLTWFSTYIGGFSLKLAGNATHLSKNATIFAKGCCIYWGIVVRVQSHFRSIVCLFNVPSFIYSEDIAWIGACSNCLFLKCDLSFNQWSHFLQRVVAYLEEWCSFCKVILQCCLQIADIYIYIRYIYIIYQIYVSFNIYREHIDLSNPSNFTMAGQHPSAPATALLSTVSWWVLGWYPRAATVFGRNKTGFRPANSMRNPSSWSQFSGLSVSSRHLQHFPPTSMTTFVSLGFMIHLGQSLRPRILAFLQSADPEILARLSWTPFILFYSKDFCFRGFGFITKLYTLW